jgi:hypothetical protein
MQMVNAGFPEPAGYGFEMVDTAGFAFFSHNAAVNRKFTPNQINRFFREFSAI